MFHFLSILWVFASNWLAWKAEFLELKPGRHQAAATDVHGLRTAEMFLSASYEQSSQVTEVICGLSPAKVIGKNFKKANKLSACFGKCKLEMCFIAVSEWELLTEESTERQRWEMTFQELSPWWHMALFHQGLFTSIATARSPESFPCQLSHQF